MLEAITITSPLVYLYRIEALDWLKSLFTDIWIPRAVIVELQEDQRRGYDVPSHEAFHGYKLLILARSPQSGSL